MRCAEHRRRASTGSRRRGCASQLQRRKRLRADALSPDDRPPSDPHGRAAIGPRRIAARHHSVGDHPRRSFSPRRATQPRCTANGIWATERAAFRRTVGSTSGTAFRARPTKACSRAGRLRPRSRAAAVRHGGLKGEPASNRELYDLDMRRRIDAELDARTIDFMAAGGQRPALLRLRALDATPLIRRCRIAISRAGPGKGDFADSMIEMDHRVGEMLDAVDALGIARDNAFHFRQRQRSRVPPAVARHRRPVDRHVPHGDGRRAAGAVHRALARTDAGRACDNEIVHIVDLFSTLARLAGARAPDRPIDGVDQLDFLLGRPRNRCARVSSTTSRTNCAPPNGATGKCTSSGRRSQTPGQSPNALSLQPHPGSEGGDRRQHEQSWVRGPIRKMINAFQRH